MTKNKKVAAFDTETYYDDDIAAKMGMWNYTHHFLFECFTISFATSEGVEWSGHPKDCPWDKLRGHVFVSHNRSFDHMVLLRLIEQGTAPADIMPEEWYCSANLCAYLGFPRALAQAVGVLYNVNLSKATRGALKFLHWQDMTEEFQAEVIRYAIDDSRWCLKIWMDYNDQWPELERKVALHTDMMGARGVPIDVETLDKALEMVTKAHAAAFDALPWTKPWQIDPNAEEPLPEEKPLSKKGLNILCAHHGLIPPESLAEDDEECAAWEEKFGPLYPWVAAMRNYRRVNSLLKKITTMRGKVKPDGWMEFSFFYFGADTGRWSGTGGVNMQNLPQDDFMFDKDLMLTDDEKLATYTFGMRQLIRAEEGMTLAVSDLSAIEPRCAAVLTKNTDMLALFEQGFGPYEALARTTMGWNKGKLKDEDPLLYALCKAKLLAFIYGAGWHKFISMSVEYVGKENSERILQVEPPEHEVKSFKWFIENPKNRFNETYRAEYATLDEKGLWTWVNAYIHMRDFRAGDDKLRATWEHCGNVAKRSLGGTAEYGLPSGRSLRFLNLHTREGQLMCRTIKGGSFSKYYGPKIFQNCNQAFARDVFAEAILRIEAAGISVILHVHDEVVCHVPKDFDKSILTQLMTARPTWAKRLPVASETKVMSHYEK